jgi:hypothetical protein
MAVQRMDVTAFVGKLLEQDDVDVLRACRCWPSW